MADYYPVLKRAISSLPSSSGEARRAVYERARAALLKQLQSYDPPLPPNEVTDQRLALEECIRRVESETAGAAFGLTPDTPPPAGGTVQVEPRPADPERKPEPRPEPKVEAKADPRPEPAAKPVVAEAPVTSQNAMPPVQAPVQQAVQPPMQLPRATPQPTNPGFTARTPATETDAAKPRTEPRFESRSAPKPDAPPANTDKPAGEALLPRPDVGLNAGISAVTKTLKSAESLGQAATTASRMARDTIEIHEAPKPAPVSAPPRIEPDFEARMPPRSEPRLPGSNTIPPLPPEPAPVRPSRPPAESGFSLDLPPPRRRLISPAVAGLLVVLLLLVGAGGYAFTQRDVITAFLVGTGVDRPATATDVPAPAGDDGLEPKILDRLPQDGATTTPVADDAVAVATERVANSELDPGIPSPPGTDAVATTPVAVDTPATDTPAIATPATDTPAVATDIPAAEIPVQPLPATNDTPVTPATDTTAAATPAGDNPPIIVAQRAILYEEPVPGSQGAKLDGQVLWSFSNEPPLPGEPATPQVKATIEIPDRKIKMTLSFRKNSDPAFPASHVTEIKFDLPADFNGGGIDTTPGLILKQTEDARGDPLIGAVAKVADNIFWVALSGADPDRTRNLSLLREREWIDVPIRYTNRRRAIITFEKGTPGARAFEQAFAVWQ